MNFLITGGAGSVGQDLTAVLLKKGHRVRVLDKQSEPVPPLPHDYKLELGAGEAGRPVARSGRAPWHPDAGCTWHGPFPMVRPHFWRAT